MLCWKYRFEGCSTAERNTRLTQHGFLEETEILQQGRGMLKQRSSKEALEVHFQERTQDLHTWCKEMPNKQVEATLHGRITEIDKLQARNMTGSKWRPNSVTV